MRHVSKPAVPQWGSTGEANSRGSRWSSSPVEDNDNNAWNVNFNNGNVNNNDVNNDKHVRCVR